MRGEMPGIMPGIMSEKSLARTAFRPIGLSVAALALMLGGCGSSSGTPAASAPAPATLAPTTTTIEQPTQVLVSPAAVKVIPGSATGNSPCEKAAPTPASPGEVGAGAGGSAQVNSPAEVAAAEHGVRGKVEQVPLTKAEQDVLNSQMAAADSVAKRYPTVKDALAAGYAMSTVYVPCIGAHYTNFHLVAQFDPSRPSELLYDGTSPNSKILGLSYLVYHHAGAPLGFAGVNDRWHQHNANGGLCIQGGVVVGGEETTRAECAARGGQKTLLADIWMVHAWVVPGVACTWGTFSGECPALGGRIGGTAEDPPAPSNT